MIKELEHWLKGCFLKYFSDEKDKEYKTTLKGITGEKGDMSYKDETNSRHILAGSNLLIAIWGLLFESRG